VNQFLVLKLDICFATEMQTNLL